MLQIHKTTFKESEESHAEEVVLLGGLSLRMSYRIAKEARGETDVIKERMKQQMWHDTYGELTQPIRELEHYARRGASVGEYEQITKLCETIDSLLAYPRSDAPLSPNLRMSDAPPQPRSDGRVPGGGERAEKHPDAE